MRAIVLGALAMGALLAVNTASGEILHFRARLAPPSASPPSQRGAGGLAEATLDTDSRILSWKVSYSGLSGPLTGAHFKAPPEPGAPAGATMDLAPRLTNPMVASTRLNDIQIGDLRAGLWSVNLLTPQGEIGGDLERAP
jgi:CHRD domain